MSESELPKNWTLTTLDSIGQIISGGTPSTTVENYWGDDISWISPVDLSGYNSKYIAKGGKSITSLGLVKSSAKLMPKGSVLFSSRAPIGYVAIAAKELCTNQGFKSVIPNDSIYNEYLYYFLKSAKRKADELASGTTFKEISLSKFSIIEIPLPPLAEQHRIVAKIEELFSELDKGVETLKTAQEQLKVYRQAVLKYAFEGKLTNPDVKDGELPEGWSLKTVKDISEGIQYGYTESSSKKNVGPKFLRITDIQDNKVDWSSVPYCTISNDEIPKYQLYDGDLVFARTGATVGKSFLIKGDIPTSVFASYLIRVRFPKAVNDKYIWYYFQSPMYWVQIIDKSVGTGQPNVNGTKLGEINLVLPKDIKEQIEIVNKIESRLSVCDKIEESIEQGLQQAEALRQSILKKAFEGKLVSQDPNDEPASVLLERIKAERNSVTPVKKTKTKKTKA